MTENSKRSIKRRIEELEATIVTDTPSIELSDEDKDRLDEIYTEAREVLTDDECARLDELEEQLASEGFTDGDAPTTATEPYPDLTPAANEYLDLVFGVSPKRQLERRMG